MRFYQIPGNLSEEINQLEAEIASFKAGETHPTKFRAFRVPFGIYEQRTDNTFMIRIRCTSGGATPSQLIKVGELASRYGKPLVHITTRQEMQLHYIGLDDAPAVLRQLMEVGLSTRGGGGNTVRNIMASYDSGINPSEIFDVTPYAIALSSRLIKEPDSWNLPRKFKISFSALEADNSLAVFNDLGYIARIKDGKKGFQVFTAGGMGCRPRLGRLLHDFITDDKVYHVCAALKRLFLKHGNRKNKNSNRMRFLWDELGEQGFLSLYRKEFEKIQNDSKLALEVSVIENDTPASRIKPIAISSNVFETWKSRYVSTQKQPGLMSIFIPINLGDLSADDAIKLGRLLEPFGENVLRFTMNQNIALRNIPEEYLGTIFAGILEIETLSHLPGIFGNIVACTGADTCTLGVCLPRNATPAVQRYLLGSTAGFNLPSDFKINISGCPNACGQHHLGDLGFFGRVARRNGRAYPAFYVLAGAELKAPDPHFAERVGWIPSRDLPAAIFEILAAYNKKVDQFPDFAAYFANGGRGEIAAVCEKYNKNVPTFEENKNWFFDWGATSIFTTAKMGHGECSAGIYDMIEVEMKAIKNYQKLVKKSTNPEEIQLALRNIVYSASNMLLVTRGVDPRTENETFELYLRHFIETKLVPERFREIVLLAKNNNYNALEKNKEEALELGEIMIRLYHLMDNSLRFPGDAEREEISSILACPVPQTTAAGKDHVVKLSDFRGIACPLNFVKTKMELARIQSGQCLEIWLDDGEPIDNVPRSVTSEGHKVLSKKRIKKYWSVVIEKV